MLDWLLPPLARARRAARAAKWAAAARAYRRHLARHPLDAAAWKQLGHNVKAMGDLDGAVAAYREAVRIAPDVADSWIHLAHSQRGDRKTAIATLLRAIDAGGGSARAVEMLLALGVRDLLPLALQQRIEAEEDTYAPSRYAAWVASRPASVAAVARGVTVVIDGRRGDDAAIAATRATLGALPVKILDCDVGEGALPRTPLLLVDAGTRIAPDAAARLHAAVVETGAGAAYCDHDHWQEGAVRRDPIFQPMFDPVWFARASSRPPCLLVTAGAARPCATWGELFLRRLALPVPYVHVPLLLASRHVDATVADILPLVADATGEEAVQVIVQTRDAPDMLRRCIETLRATADRPELLDIVIVDNRSALPETAALLADWSERGIVRVIAHDAPFNWALANNLAAGRGDAPLLLFLNNDVEMQSGGWDTALREGLTTARVGALGALLLYPDGTIQHGGVVFGVGQGGPLHEGIGHLPDPGGPGGRWRDPRMAAAVTGAWLAVSRAVFDEVRGFEERLPVGYNDIDFCLRVRAAGRAVVQASHIVALHRESATRGVVMSPEAQARDEAEWGWMRARWGAALDLDPAYNPHWSRKGRPFDGIVAPSDAAVARWVTASARVWPWESTYRT